MAVADLAPFFPCPTNVLAVEASTAGPYGKGPKRTAAPPSAAGATSPGQGQSTASRLGSNRPLSPPASPTPCGPRGLGSTSSAAPAAAGGPFAGRGASAAQALGAAFAAAAIEPQGMDSRAAAAGTLAGSSGARQAGGVRSRVPLWRRVLGLSGRGGAAAAAPPDPRAVAAAAAAAHTPPHAKAATSSPTPNGRRCEQPKHGAFLGGGVGAGSPLLSGHVLGQAGSGRSAAAMAPPTPSVRPSGPATVFAARSHSDGDAAEAESISAGKCAPASGSSSGSQGTRLLQQQPAPMSVDVRGAPGGDVLSDGGNSISGQVQAVAESPVKGMYTLQESFSLPASRTVFAAGMLSSPERGSGSVGGAADRLPLAQLGSPQGSLGRSSRSDGGAGAAGPPSPACAGVGSRQHGPRPKACMALGLGHGMHGPRRGVHDTEGGSSDASEQQGQPGGGLQQQQLCAPLRSSGGAGVSGPTGRPAERRTSPVQSWSLSLLAEMAGDAAARQSQEAAGWFSCLVCMDGPREHGFLHAQGGWVVHLGVCSDCAARITQGEAGLLCPVCRCPADRFVEVVV